MTRPHLFFTIADRIIHEIHEHNRRAAGRADFVVMPSLLADELHDELIQLAKVRTSVKDLSKTFAQRLTDGEVRIMDVQVLTGPRWGAGSYS